MLRRAYWIYQQPRPVPCCSPACPSDVHTLQPSYVAQSLAAASREARQRPTSSAPRAAADQVHAPRPRAHFQTARPSARGGAARRRRRVVVRVLRQPRRRCCAHAFLQDPHARGRRARARVARARRAAVARLPQGFWRRAGHASARGDCRPGRRGPHGDAIQVWRGRRPANRRGLVTRLAPHRRPERHTRAHRCGEPSSLARAVRLAAARPGLPRSAAAGV